MSRRALAGIGLAMLVTALPSCALFKSGETLAVYGLAMQQERTTAAPVRWQLVVDEPVASASLSGTRIAVAPGDHAFGVLAGARWTDRAPALVQALLLNAYEDSGRLLGVGSTATSVRGDFVLLSELRHFEVVHGADGGRRATLVLSAKLVRNDSNEVVAARVFEHSEDVQGGGAEATVAAFERVVNVALPEVVEWSIDAGEVNWLATAQAKGKD